VYAQGGRGVFVPHHSAAHMVPCSLLIMYSAFGVVRLLFVEMCLVKKWLPQAQCVRVGACWGFLHLPDCYPHQLISNTCTAHRQVGIVSNYCLQHHNTVMNGGDVAETVVRWPAMTVTYHIQALICGTAFLREFCSLVGLTNAVTIADLAVYMHGVCMLVDKQATAATAFCRFMPLIVPPSGHPLLSAAAAPLVLVLSMNVYSCSWL